MINLNIHIKKVISYLIDYIFVMFFVLIFMFCSRVFMLDESTINKSYLMLICAVIVVLIFTTYVPTKSNGQTFGQKIMKLKVVNINSKDRTYLQSFIRECLIKVSCAPIFIIFTVVYFIFGLITKKTTDIEMPIDFILKTKVINL